MDLDEDTLEALGGGGFWARTAVKAATARARDLAVKLAYRAAQNKRPAEDAPCPGCKRTDFDRRPKGWLREFCSDACRRLHHNIEFRKNRAALVDRPTHCGHCQQPITQDLTSRAKHFCNESCAKKHKRIQTKMSETLVEKNGFKICICCKVQRPVGSMVETMLHGQAGLQCNDRKWCHEERTNPNQPRKGSESWKAKRT